MPDPNELSDADVFGPAPPAAPAPSGGAGELSDADVFGSPSASPTFLGTLESSVTAAPKAIYNAGKSALGDLWQNEQNQVAATQANPSNVLTDWIGTGGKLANVAAAPLAPVSNVVRATAQGLAEPITSALQGAGTLAAHAVNSNPTLPSRQDVYNQIEPEVETAIGLATPRALPMRAPVPLPARPVPGPLGVTLSEGQATGDLSAIQREQAALRGTSGPTAQERAQQFATQQKSQVGAANDALNRALDPFGMQVAENPQEAGAVVSQGLQNTAASRKAGVTQAYETAKSYPGEIHAGVFEGMGQGIKGDLTLGNSPVIIDDKLTPFASKMVDDLDNSISQLRIQNKADPFGQPDPANITGVNLNGVDQMRKRLVAFKQGAWSNNASDGRAASAILNSFDERVDQAVNGGRFNGDPRAIQAWNDARAAHSDYRGDFTAAKGDPVGRVVEKIIGKNSIGPTPAGPAIPNDVADYLYGAAGTNPGSLNVGVANRVKSLLGEQSPEWSAVKQGLFKRLTDSGEGVTDWGPAKVAQRLNKFLNVDGVEMSQAVFNPNERAMLQNYADLMRKLEVPQAGANWSNTATFMARAVNSIGGKLGMLVGAGLGRAVMPFAPPLVAEGMGAAAAAGAGKAAQAIQARSVAKQLPLVSQQLQQWQRAVAAAMRLNSPPSKAAAAAATLNLSRSLAPLGINFQQIAGQSTGTAYGAPDQQNVVRPPAQQQNGGAVQQKAKGGAVGHKGPVESASGAEKGPKATKATAHYRGGTAKKECKMCRMFEPPNECSSVRGKISPHGLCDYYEAKAKEDLGHERAA